MPAVFDFTGKVALVAGGAGYLCTPVCRKMAELGATVVIADIDVERAEALAEEISAGTPGAVAKGTALDITSEESVKSVMDYVVAEFGALHIMVNAAYRYVVREVEELTADEFDSLLHLNLTSAFMLSREAGRVMKSGGSIINFASLYGLVAPDPAMYKPPKKLSPLDYGVAKAGIVQMTRYLAVWWGPRNIRVNAIAPGQFPRPEAQEANPEHMKRIEAKVPLRRVGRQEEIAGAVIFLASDEASYVTGHVLNVDGGWTIW